MRQPNPKQYFRDVDQVYRERLNAFVSLASRYVYNKDHAIDVVHSAVARSVAYFNKHPEKKVREQIINWLILKECKKKNKESRESTRDAEWFQEEVNVNPIRSGRRIVAPEQD